MRFMDDGSLVLIYYTSAYFNAFHCILRLYPRSRKLAWKKKLDFDAFRHHGIKRGGGGIMDMLLSDDQKSLHLFGYFGLETNDSASTKEFYGAIFTLNFYSGEISQSFLYDSTCQKETYGSVDAGASMAYGDDFKFSKVPGKEFVFRTFHYFSLLDRRYGLYETQGQIQCKKVVRQQFFSKHKRKLDVLWLEAQEDGDMLIIASEFSHDDKELLDKFILKVNPHTNEIKWFGNAFNRRLGRDEKWKKEFFPDHHLQKIKGKNNGFFFSENYYQIYNERFWTNGRGEWIRRPTPNRKLLSEMHIHRLGEDGKNPSCGIQEINQKDGMGLDRYGNKKFDVEVEDYPYYEKEDPKKYNDLLKFETTNVNDLEFSISSTNDLGISARVDSSSISTDYSVCERKESSWLFFGVTVFISLGACIVLGSICVVIFAVLWKKKRMVGNPEKNTGVNEGEESEHSGSSTGLETSTSFASTSEGEV